ncbi:hypothetical protein BJ742DRAFT_828103 [Cladochytrium replicatum]|nr:hypothetical protein BJ742DRAFT_828103 [Cladochytrium replicatum]
MSCDLNSERADSSPACNCPMEGSIDLSDALKVRKMEHPTPQPITTPVCEKSIRGSNEPISTSLHKSENISVDTTLPIREFATLAALDEQPLGHVASAAGAVEPSTAVSRGSSFSTVCSDSISAFPLSTDQLVEFPKTSDHDDWFDGVMGDSVVLDVGIESTPERNATVLGAHHSSDKNSEIPRFYFPPGTEFPGTEALESDFLKRIRGLFLVESNSESSSKTSATASTITTSTNSPRSSNSSPLAGLARHRQTLQLHEQGLTELEFIAVTIACGLPRYINAALFQQSLEMSCEPYCNIPTTDLCNPRRPWSLRSKMTETQAGIEDEEMSVPAATFDGFARAWGKLVAQFKDEEAICFGALRCKNSHALTPEDFESVLEDVVQHHPGLEFLSDMPVFQLRYVETVISRLFYIKTRNWTDSMSLSEFRKTGFADILRKLEQDDDINATRHIFSYKHFYVIYCKFWEHDKDHDMLIDESAIEHYDGGALTKRCAARVMEVYRNMKSGGRDIRTIWPGGTSSCQLTYRDFITFILSVEDKKSPSSVEFWFRVLDRDGDGMLSFHELQWFWEEQFERMVDMRYSDPWKFNDFLCSLIDLVKPQHDNFITLRDLKRCKQCSLFFDMLFDLRHYELYIRRFDPQFREHDEVYILDREGRRVKLEGWEKFAERAYDELAIEESQQNYRSSSGYSMQYRPGDLNGVISLELLAHTFDDEIEIDLSGSNQARDSTSDRDEVDEPSAFEAWAGGKSTEESVEEVEHEGSGKVASKLAENSGGSVSRLPQMIQNTSISRRRENNNVDGLALAADGFACEIGAHISVVAVSTASSLLVQRNSHKHTSANEGKGSDDDIVDHTITSCSKVDLKEQGGKEEAGETMLEEVEIIFEEELHGDNDEDIIGHVVTGEFVVIEASEGESGSSVRKRPRPRTSSAPRRVRAPSPGSGNGSDISSNGHIRDMGWVSLVSGDPVRKRVVASGIASDSDADHPNYVIESAGNAKKLISASHRRSGVLRRAKSGKGHRDSSLEIDLAGGVDGGVDVANENAEL